MSSVITVATLILACSFFLRSEQKSTNFNYNSAFLLCRTYVTNTQMYPVQFRSEGKRFVLITLLVIKTGIRPDLSPGLDFIQLQCLRKGCRTVWEDIQKQREDYQLSPRNEHPLVSKNFSSLGAA